MIPYSSTYLYLELNLDNIIFREGEPERIGERGIERESIAERIQVIRSS